MAHVFAGRRLREFASKEEPWKEAHDQVMRNYEEADALASVVRFLMFALNELERSCTQIQRERIVEFTLAWAENVAEYYESWYKIAGRVENRIGELGTGYVDEETVRLLSDGIARVGVILPELRRRSDIIAEIRQGKTVSFQEALDGMGSASP